MCDMVVYWFVCCFGFVGIGVIGDGDIVEFGVWFFR